MNNLKTTKQLIQMVPENELSFVNEFLKKIIRTWNPDFTKTTKKEKRAIEKAEMEYKNGEVFSDDDVWK